MKVPLLKANDFKIITTGDWSPVLCFDPNPVRVKPVPGGLDLYCDNGYPNPTYIFKFELSQGGELDYVECGVSKPHTWSDFNIDPIPPQIEGGLDPCGVQFPHPPHPSFKGPGACPGRPGAVVFNVKDTPGWEPGVYIILIPGAQTELPEDAPAGAYPWVRYDHCPSAVVRKMPHRISVRRFLKKIWPQL